MLTRQQLQVLSELSGIEMQVSEQELEGQSFVLSELSGIEIWTLNLHKEKQNKFYLN